MSSYPRLMADAAFHARNARVSLERAQGKAPEDSRAKLDDAIWNAEQLRRFAARSARTVARRGGIRRAA